MNYGNLEWGPTIFAAVLVGLGSGLLGLTTQQGLGLWCLVIAARVMLR